MPTGSGIDAQFGFAAEVTVGTAVTVSRFLEFNSETVQWTPTFQQAPTVRTGVRYARKSMRVRTVQTVDGGIDLPVTNVDFGLLFKHSLGAASTSTVTTGVFRHIYTPEDMLGLSLTLQIGRPESGDGDVIPFTYNGVKIANWTLACDVDGFLGYQADLDGWGQTTSTALVTASYDSALELFAGQNLCIKIGGTVTTSAGFTSVTGNASLNGVTGFSLTNATPMATGRHFFCGSGVKAQQLENGTRELTGSFTAEFYDRAALYDVFTGATTTALQFIVTGTNMTGSNPYKVEVTLPCVQFTQVSPQVSGPDIVPQTVEFVALDNGLGDPTVQVVYVTSDSAP